MTTSLEQRRTVQGVLDQYGLGLRACHGSGHRYLLFTDKGPFALYAVKRDEQTLQFMFHVTEYLITAGFDQVCRVVCTTAGIPWVKQGEDIYYLSDQGWGGPPRPDNPSDIAKTAEALALMHQHGLGLPPSPFDRVRAGQLPNLFRTRISELQRLQDQVAGRKKSFDKQFLDYVDDFVTLGESALRSLDSSPYGDLAKYAAQERQLCHRGFAPGNLVRGREGIKVGGFHRSAIDLRVVDLARLCAEMGGWSAGRIGELVRAYDAINPLQPGELEILNAWLRFPREFWWVSHSHYFHHATAKERLRELTRTAAVREVCLMQLSREVNSMEETPYKERFIPVTWESLDDPIPEVLYQAEPASAPPAGQPTEPMPVWTWQPAIPEPVAQTPFPVEPVALEPPSAQPAAVEALLPGEPLEAAAISEPVPEPVEEPVLVPVEERVMAAAAAPEEAKVEPEQPAILSWRAFPAPLKRC